MVDTYTRTYSKVKKAGGTHKKQQIEMLNRGLKVNLKVNLTPSLQSSDSIFLEKEEFLIAKLSFGLRRCMYIFILFSADLSG